MTVPPSAACPLEQGGRPTCHRCALTGLCFCFNICPSRVTPDLWVQLNIECKLSVIDSLPIYCKNLPTHVHMDFGQCLARGRGGEEADSHLSPRRGFPTLTGYSGDPRAPSVGWVELSMSACGIFSVRPIRVTTACEKDLTTKSTCQITGWRSQRCRCEQRVGRKLLRREHVDASQGRSLPEEGDCLRKVRFF